MQEVGISSEALIGALLDLRPERRLSLLDSCGARGGAARFLIAGFDPFETIEARGSQLRIEERAAASARTERGNVLELLDERLKKYGAGQAEPASLPAASGACIATLSYELARGFERRLAGTPRAGEEPDAVFAFYDTLVIHDYKRGATHITGCGGPARIAETLEAMSGSAHRERRAGPKIYARASSRVASNMTRDEYLSAVSRIQEHIAAGDIYQANLTQQLDCTLEEGSGAEDVFLHLRREHPASFAAFLRRREDTVVSASPERFLRVEPKHGERQVEAWPIKGTRPRGLDRGEDDALRAELLSSEKERAENVMIVDLLRNDLGRVCRFGSVRVHELCTVEEHPTLFHLVSRVRGVLSEGVSVGQLLRAAFPCGSITGAPKIRAMQIIGEQEKSARGLSMGALGYFAFDGSLDLSVAIRTMVVREGLARFNVGGGIVADSLPEAEYAESWLKARALLTALGHSPTATGDDAVP